MRLPPDIHEALRRIGERDDRPLSGIVRQALRQHLAEELAAIADQEREGMAKAS